MARLLRAEGTPAVLLSRGVSSSDLPLSEVVTGGFGTAACEWEWLWPGLLEAAALGELSWWLWAVQVRMLGEGWQLL